MNRHVPQFLQVDPLPSDHADEVGSAYVGALSFETRRGLGQYLTPPDLARFAAGMIDVAGDSVRVLDPAAGAGVLGCAAVERLVLAGCREIHLVAHEIDGLLALRLGGVLEAMKDWAGAQGARVTFEVHPTDFVLAHAEALRVGGDLFGSAPEGTFDLVIANPPYFKISKDDIRARYARDVVHGQPNIYGLFMAIGAAMLRPGGQLAYIVPRSFASGQYFNALRASFFSRVRPTRIHAFESREDAFGRDEVLQENVVLAGRREDGWSAGDLIVGSSAGLADLDARKPRAHPMAEVLDLGSRDKILRIPSSCASAGAAVDVVNSWAGYLGAYGWKVSTGPIVAFRAKGLESPDAGEGRVPFLWMAHVTPMAVNWPLSGRKPDYIASGPEAKGLLVGNGNYVLMRRFSPKEDKRRIVAAPFLAADHPFDGVGFENHLNFIHHPKGGMTEDEVIGLASVLNSSLLDAWFRAVSGNTQVSATEMRKMPIPDLHLIREIGRRARGIVDLEVVDRIVADTVAL